MRWTRRPRLTSVVTSVRRNRLGPTPRCWRQVGGSESRSRRWWQESRSPGRSRISRKAIAWGRPACCQLNLYARRQPILLQHACETAGAARTRPSPRPLLFRRANEMQNLGRSAPREGSLLSYATRKTGATGPCMSATPMTRSSCSPSPSSSASRTERLSCCRRVRPSCRCSAASMRSCRGATA